MVISAVRSVASPQKHTPSPPATAVAIIPARYHSTRLPGKALADIAGRPMVEHVYRRTAAATAVGSVLVATDDQRIAAAVAAFGGETRMTSTVHRTGMDRLAEVADTLSCDLVANVQGDEPLIDPLLIDAVLGALADAPEVGMATAHCPIVDPADLDDPNIVKVVVDGSGDALYFSRAPIPHRRARAVTGAPLGYKHIGVYAYRRACLLRLARLGPTTLEQCEQLEQLRALESGIRIRTVETTSDPIGVDTPEDLVRVRRLVSSQR